MPPPGSSFATASAGRGRPYSCLSSSSRCSAWRTFRTLERPQTLIYLQQFVPHPGWDLRAFVLGGRVLAAMRRHANGGWRTNVAQGGKAEPTELPPELARLAVRAAEVVGAVAAGVDLLPGPAGQWYVIEVNAVPGWRALGPVAGVDVAGPLVGFMTDGSNGPPQTDGLGLFGPGG